MEIRKYRPEDLPEIARLFEETIRQVNAGDYTKEQIQAWASRGRGLLGRNEFFERLYTLVGRGLPRQSAAGLRSMPGSLEESGSPFTRPLQPDPFLKKEAMRRWKNTRRFSMEFR